MAGRFNEWMIVLDMKCEECNTSFYAPVTEIRRDMDMNMRVDDPLRTRAILDSLLEWCYQVMEALTVNHSHHTSSAFLGEAPVSEFVWGLGCSVPKWQVFRRLCVYWLRVACARHLSFGFAN